MCPYHRHCPDYSISDQICHKIEHYMDCKQYFEQERNDRIRAELHIRESKERIWLKKRKMRRI